LTLLKGHERRNERVETKLLKSVAGYIPYTLQIKEVVREELNMYHLNKIIADYRYKWT
jgi:hypothetical protein